MVGIIDLRTKLSLIKLSYLTYFQKLLKFYRESHLTHHAFEFHNYTVVMQTAYRAFSRARSNELRNLAVKL